MTQFATTNLDAPPVEACSGKPDPGVFERNLAALERASRETVEKLRRTPARIDVQFHAADDGALSASIGVDASSRQLASRRRPLDEARKLIEPIDLAHAAVFVLAGFGVGHHAAELARKVGRSGVLVIFEPDVALLRAVLERVDHSAWINETNVCILTEPENATAMSEVLRGVEGFVGMGVRLIEHPASTQRMGAHTSAFFQRFTSVVEAVKLTVVTTLVQVRVTMRNLFQNLETYGRAPGVGDLHGVCAGKPAIVVSAGPSLKRNIDLLTDPAVRDRFVIVAVQTVLRPLLAKGIKPHFVTALDYSEISRRFYEGLIASDVEGITLVVEPKVNPAVLDAWPKGAAVRCIGDRTLDLLLGRDLKDREARREYVKPGATVAHLAYSLARHLGCDPVVLIGQDLGFTDGQYYAAGAAIHDVWACELNEFNTLEMLEFQRIARMGAHLRTATDILGRPIHTDEQMLTYLRQFEQEFKLDEQRGLRTIDATEGGVRKEHTAISTLAAVLAERTRADPHGIAAIAGASRRTAAPLSVASLEDRLIAAQRQTARVGEISKAVSTMLTELIEHHEDQERVNRLIGRIDDKTREVVALDPAFTLVQLLGQSMVFNRVKADRLIGIDDSLSPMERQKRQAERDLANVRATARTARELGTLLTDALQALRTGVRQSHDIPAEQLLEREAHEDARGAGALKGDGATSNATVVAIIPVDLHRSGLNTPRRLDRPCAGAPSVLSATVRRLRRCDRVRQIALLTDDPDACRALLDDDDLRGSTQVIFVRVPAGQVHTRRAGVASARLLARPCWRGGIANLTCYDELFEPVVLAQALDHLKADGALLVGPDWCVVDPALCDEVVDRFIEDPIRHRLTVTQAAPGLCGCVIASSLVREIAASGSRGRAAASIGGLLGYSPRAPIMDLLGTRVCVNVEPVVRDAGVRFIADFDAACDALSGAGPSGTAAAIVQACGAGLEAIGAEELVIDLDPLCADASAVARQVSTFIVQRADGVVTLRARSVNASAALACIRAACDAGAAGVHARIPESRIGGDPRAWLESGASVISVDVDPIRLAAGEFAPALETLVALRAAACASGGSAGAAGGNDFRTPLPWIVPRLIRSDMMYPHIQAFMNHWIDACGWCVLDPRDAPRPGERIAPLPIPAAATRRIARSQTIAQVHA